MRRRQRPAVVLTGSAGEAASSTTSRAHARPRDDLAGETTLGALGALIDGADAIVCNDTSVSHIAAALGCPSVVVSCGADVARWAPLDRAVTASSGRHCRAARARTRDCPVGHACAQAITADDVLAALDGVTRRREAREETLEGATP
jgi:ADP-heptose:LPS heptosyltransferase